ncbi:MAG: isopentenyl-diphosphate Delta-isomerase [Devosiaceae bacterium]|nr:isopentenyl-diphosphate Delta-isomerase [Devosiaceae bacterium MH13]
MIPAIAADGSLYPIEKMQAHRDAQLHLAISVFVMCPDRHLLLVQRRALTKYHCGGQWANTCCSHPHWDESPRAAAERRLAEELGLQLEDPLEPLGQLDYRADVGHGMTEHERVHLFRAILDPASISLTLNPDEVAETAWTPVSELKQQAQNAPETIAPWFRIYLLEHADRWTL